MENSIEQKSILVVDDEEGIRSTMVEILQDKGHKVFEASNGVVGLKMCAENTIDLIVLDISMPRMDGYTFLQYLKARWERDNRRWKLPHIFVLTAVEAKADMSLAKNLGANRFMNKPFKTSEFLKTVTELLSD